MHFVLQLTCPDDKYKVYLLYRKSAKTVNLCDLKIREGKGDSYDIRI